MPSGSTRKRGPLLVGLTGGFGSGKSTVLQMFRRKGARTLDADAIVHGLLASDAPVRRSIVRKFGREILGRSGGIDRKALAARVFSSHPDRRALERILHPVVRRRIVQALKSLKQGVAVVDVPLLFESGWRKRFDVVVVVDAQRKKRRRRLRARGFPAVEFERRARAQWPLGRKVRRADFVIDNNGTKKRTAREVDAIWKQLTNHHRVVRGMNGIAART